MNYSNITMMITRNWVYQGGREKIVKLCDNAVFDRFYAISS
jgi:hypothetical protein